MTKDSARIQKCDQWPTITVRVGDTPFMAHSVSEFSWFTKMNSYKKEIILNEEKKGIKGLAFLPF